MGYSSYSFEQRSVRTSNYQQKSQEEIFTSRDLSEKMNPKKALIRESRDSDVHPNSIAIIIGLDVTGSMGFIPEKLIKVGLPNLISHLMEMGINDPQILFVAIGDHKSDKAPFQVGQFESGDAEMDMWLETVWLEGNGGGNSHESYGLTWWFAANRTSIDCFEKRNQKGFIFTIGDERFHEDINPSNLRSIMGGEEFGREPVPFSDFYQMASEKYEIFHLHCTEGSYGTGPLYQWRDLLGEDYAICINDINTIPKVIAEKVIMHLKKSNKTVQKETSSEEQSLKITL